MRLPEALPLLFGALTSAARLTLTIPSTHLLQNPSLLPPTTHATLQSSGAPYSAPLSRANTFVFSNLTAGSYLATVHCRDFAFEPLRVDVTVEGDGKGSEQEKVVVWQTFLGNEWDNKGEKRGEGPSGVVAEVWPIGAKEYYEVRGGCEYIPILDVVIRGRFEGRLIRCYSFAAVILKESDDSYGALLAGVDCGDALFDGE